MDLGKLLDDATASEREEPEGHRQPTTSTVGTRLVESDEFVRLLAVDVALVVVVRGGLVPEFEHVEAAGPEVTADRGEVRRDLTCGEHVSEAAKHTDRHVESRLEVEAGHVPLDEGHREVLPSQL